MNDSTHTTHADNLNRDSRSGRFCPKGPQTIKKREHARRQKVYRAQLKDHKSRVHEEYLHCFCILGSRKDEIPVRRCNNPLLSVFEKLVKEDYRLGVNLQLQSIRTYCAQTLALHRENMPPSLHNQDPRKTSKSCKGVRLPSLIRAATEMTKVKRWLTWALAEGVLSVESVEAGMEICQNAISDFSLRSPRDTGSCRQALSNRNQNDGNIQRYCPNCRCNNCIASPASQNRGPSGESEADHGGVRNGASPEQLRTSSTSLQSGADAVNDIDYLPSIDCNDENRSPVPPADVEKAMTIRKKLFDTAKDDVTYLMLCLLFDETMELEFGTFSNIYMDEFRRQGVEPSRILREVFLYTRHKRYAAAVTQEHLEREKELHFTMLLLEKARVSLRLPVYKDMKWNFTSFIPNRQRDTHETRQLQGRDELDLNN